MHLYGKDHGLTQRAVSTDAAGSSDICERPEVVAPEVRSGLGGASPFDRLRSWTEPVRRIQDERALDALLAELAGGDWSTIRKSGIRLGNLDYIAGELAPLVGERVRLSVQRGARATGFLSVAWAARSSAPRTNRQGSAPGRLGRPFLEEE